MRAIEDGTSLVVLLQQLARLAGGLCDQTVVVLLLEKVRRLQRAADQLQCLDLRLGLGDRLLVDGERLRKELVRNLLETATACRADGLQEEAQRERRIVGGRQALEVLEHKLEHALGGRVGCLVTKASDRLGQSEGTKDERRDRVLETHCRRRSLLDKCSTSREVHL